MTHKRNAHIVQINVSNGGVPKKSVPSAVVSELGIMNDNQNNKVYHGGPDRALLIFSLEKIQALQQEGHPIVPGSTGENVTVSGLDWEKLKPGVSLQIGQVLTEVTRYASPCQTISASFIDDDFSRVSQKKHPGWSRICLRILESGTITVGDSVALVS
ncbi:MAG: MOSC domain-containing protein [Candidatus Promineifilaceae bacterium]|nr:MOSC domain-containing protein [Candidatus Promineifilaceae bacterium]